MNYLLYNGSREPAGKPLLHAQNRAFLYGDSVFETMRFHKGRVMFAGDHLKRLHHGLDTLGIILPAAFDVESLAGYAAALAHENGVGGDAKLRLTVFRESGHGYLPLSSRGNWLLTAEPIDEARWNDTGLDAGYYEAAFPLLSPWSRFKTGASTLYVQAALFASRQKLDDVLIMNVHGGIADATSSNVFLTRHGTVSTPALAEGCIDGVTRKQVIGLLANRGIPVREEHVTKRMIADADELFLTNAIQGIRWVRECAGSIFGDKMSRSLFAEYLLLLG